MLFVSVVKDDVVLMSLSVLFPCLPVDFQVEWGWRGMESMVPKLRNCVREGKVRYGLHQINACFLVVYLRTRLWSLTYNRCSHALYHTIPRFNELAAFLLSGVFSMLYIGLIHRHLSRSQ